MASSALVAALLALALPAALAQCGTGQLSYSLGGASVGCCAAGVALAASGLGCKPSAQSLQGPVDTVFSFSGSIAEGVGGVAVSTDGLGYTSDRYGNPSGALNFYTGIASGVSGSLTASGSALAAALPGARQCGLGQRLCQVCPYGRRCARGRAAVGDACLRRSGRARGPGRL